MITKIYQRQMSAIKKFEFLTTIELDKFIEKCKSNPELEDQYFENSNGYSNEKEHKIVSQKLARS